MKKVIKQKKKITNQTRVSFVPRLIVPLVLVVIFGLSYLWVSSRCDVLGEKIKKEEVRLLSKQKSFRNEQDQWSVLTSAINLQRAIQKYQLGMIMPRESQIVRLEVRNTQEQVALSN